jgi:hypothetical protein
MDVSPVSTNSAMKGIARQLESNTAMQTTILKQMAEAQQQMADILQALGIGQQLDIQV